MQYSAVIVVGLPSDEVEQDGEGYYDEDGHLELVPRYYDSSDGIVGIIVQGSGDFSYNELSDKLSEHIEAAKKKFFKGTGKQGQVFLSTRGY